MNRFIQWWEKINGTGWIETPYGTRYRAVKTRNGYGIEVDSASLLESENFKRAMELSGQIVKKHRKKCPHCGK